MRRIILGKIDLASSTRKHNYSRFAIDDIIKSLLEIEINPGWGVSFRTGLRLWNTAIHALT